MPAKAIETGIGKAEVITTVKHAIGSVPIKKDVTIRDLVADMETPKETKADIEDLTDKGYWKDEKSGNKKIKNLKTNYYDYNNSNLR